ncbi:MAG: DUF202 domain-containing protein [Chloroflexi bacterium]|jgi:putative membrane protein|nr:DUF202 domain-containing protein [Chloroflexota bacterium]
MGDTSKEEQQEQEIKDLSLQLAKERSAHARKRTQWAEYRTVLANERTFSAWLRTGLAAIGVGLAIARLLADIELSVVSRIVGILLVVMGTIASVFAFWRFQQVMRVLISEDVGIGTQRVMGSLVVLLLAIVGLALWLILHAG